MFEDTSLFAEPWNFGPLINNENYTVSQLTSQVISEWGSGNFNSEPDDEHHEANLLMLDSSKAIEKLDWNPVYSVKETIGKTISWYKEFFQGLGYDHMQEFTQNQILEYVEHAKKMNIVWASNI
jgi:CDP-glucose 4,6-dehydratase